MKFDISNMIGLTTTGILGLLWWDIRRVRTTREDDKKDIAEVYLTKESHCLLCENAQLKTQKVLTDALNDAVTQIKTEIKKNGNGNGKGE